MPHGRENPYQSGHAVLWSTTWWSLLVDAYPTIAQPAEPSRRSRREICTGEGAPASLGGPSQGATRRPTARSATVHAREGSSEERCGMGGGPGRGSSPGSSRLAPRWSPGPAARRRTHTGWRWWRPRCWCPTRGYVATRYGWRLCQSAMMPTQSSATSDPFPLRPPGSLGRCRA
jgi:hypothetical protein